MISEAKDQKVFRTCPIRPFDLTSFHRNRSVFSVAYFSLYLNPQYKFFHFYLKIQYASHLMSDKTPQNNFILLRSSPKIFQCNFLIVQSSFHRHQAYLKGYGITVIYKWFFFIDHGIRPCFFHLLCLFFSLPGFLHQIL